jgi:hypothetical protein
MPKLPSEKKEQEEKINIDPEAPYEFKFKILAEYM